MEASFLLKIKGIIDQQSIFPQSTEENPTPDEVLVTQEYTILNNDRKPEIQTIYEEEDISEEPMEEEYVLDDEGTLGGGDDSIISTSEDLQIGSPYQIIATQPLIFTASPKKKIGMHSTTTTTTIPRRKDVSCSISGISKKVFLKEKVKNENEKGFKFEKLELGFHEVEGNIGSWKHARLLADGTANINAANVQYFKERLEACTAKIFENVQTNSNQPKYQARMYFCADPVKLKAVVECMLCNRKIQVSYKHTNGKFKQWINSNVLRHVETLHKNEWVGGKNEDALTKIIVK